MDVTADLRRDGPGKLLSLPWAEWTDPVPGASVVVYTDASHQETPRGKGTGAEPVVQLGGTWWGVSDTTTAGDGQHHSGVAGLALGRWIVACLCGLEAVVGEVVYGTQVAEALVAGTLQHQKDLVPRAIQWSVTPSTVVHWWIRGHVDAPGEHEDYERRRQGNAWADEYADVTAHKSACGHQVALPLSPGLCMGLNRRTA